MFKNFIVPLLFFTSFLLGNTLKLTEKEIYQTKGFFEYTLAFEDDFSPLALKDRTWSTTKEKLLNPNYRSNAYWVKFKVNNPHNKIKKLYLKAENQFTYQIEYFLMDNNRLIKYIQDGVISKNKNREFNSNHIIFPLEIQANSEVEVFFKIKNYNKINLNFELVSQEYLVNFYQTYNFYEGIFFGGLLLMLLYNLFLYLLIRVTSYLYYVGYVFWLSIYFIGLFGFSQRYFEEYTYLFYLSSAGLFIFLTLFVQSILNLSQKLPRVNTLLNLFILYFILHTSINIYVLEIEHFLYAQLLFNIFFVVTIVYVMLIIGSTYYLAYYKQDTIAKFYSIVWSIVAFSGITIPLQYLNIINIALTPEYLFQILIIVEVLCFSFILAYKINLIEEERKKQERLLIQQNKLASMGEVISMIAHQWRQPLSEINGIVLNMDLDYQKKQLNNTPFYNYLDNIESITASMSNTINNFIDYFKHHKELEEFQVSDLIYGTLNLISSTNKENIQINYKPHEKIILNSYRSELLQVLLIVLKNSIDACNHKHQENHQEAKIKIYVTPKENEIIISIQDNGVGIPEEIADKIYDPYFTTKHKTQGTGLGLYILKMIIEQTIQGEVTINSENGVTICNLKIPKNVKKINTL